LRPAAEQTHPPERDACLPYAARELDLLDAKVIVCLGAFAWDAALRLFGIRPKPKFGHGAETAAGDLVLLGCYHPSQQNTFTGVLKPEMLDAVLLRAKELAGEGPP
jgi:uracil-DNA glycosylase